MFKVDNDKFQAIKRDLDRVTCSDVTIAIKYKLPIKVIQEIKLSDYNRNKSRLIRVKELTGAELEIFKYLKK